MTAEPRESDGRDGIPLPTGAAGCPSAEDLARLLDGRLDDAERGRLEAHLADCPDCLEVAAVSGRALEAAAAPPPRLLRSLAWAASILAILGASIWLAIPDRRTVSTPETPDVSRAEAPAEAAAAASDPTGVELAGGFLAASGTGDATTLCLQSDGDTVRWAMVRGPLFVELGPESPPVRLITPHATVTVDSGEVQVNVSESRTNVLVGSGRASVEGGEGEPPLQLSAGQAARAQAARSPRRLTRDATLKVPAWVQTARTRHLEEILLAAFPVGS
jgi:ferric-dicitrate binding protein FerR (iron transport regulator)